MQLHRLHQLQYVVAVAECGSFSSADCSCLAVGPWCFYRMIAGRSLTVSLPTRSTRMHSSVPP